jgi:hypothetical protein
MSLPYRPTGSKPVDQAATAAVRSIVLSAGVRSQPFRARSIPTSALAVAGAVSVASAIGAIGADTRWLAALGSEIVSTGGVPDGVPFASAPSQGWDNVLVLAELAFHAFDLLGDRGFLLAQLAAVAVGFAVLAVDARRAGATQAATAVVLLVVVVGALPSIAVVRLQLFSLALFPVLLLLLRGETRGPSRRIWLLVPLIAVWGNLHGAVLVGLAVATVYLALERARTEPVTALGVWVASVLALFATPALERTFEYYRGVLENEAARRGVGLWEPVDPGSALGLLLVAAAVALVLLALRSRPKFWEVVALAGLAFLTIRTARSGVWLLFTAAAPAARALPVARTPRQALAIAGTVAAGALILIGVLRGPVAAASPETVKRAVSEARGTPVLAEPALAEQVVASGGRIWVGNPLDAFSRGDQRLYLDWVEGTPSGDAALSRAPRVVVVRPGSPAERRLRDNGSLDELVRDENAVVYGHAR